MSAILTLEKVSKAFGAVVIAEKMDLTLSEGEALGMLGPNGAGKTTLFGIITGRSPPTPAACFSMAATLRVSLPPSAAAWVLPGRSRSRSPSAA